MQFLKRSTAPKLPMNVECVMRETQQTITITIRSIYSGEINQDHISDFLKEIELTEKDHKLFNSFETPVKYSIVHEYRRITGKLAVIDLEKA